MSEGAVPPRSLAVLIPDGREQFHLARAFAPEWLGVLVTSLWTPPDKLPWKLLPANSASRRYHTSLAGSRVVSMPAGEIARLLRGRLERDETAAAEGINARNLAFDKLAQRTVREMRPRALIAHPSCCLETIRWCRGEGIPAILALPLAHPATVRRLQAEEAARRPEYAPYWDLGTRSQELESRYEEELRLADLILCPSEFVRDSCIENGLPADKLRVVPYGGDPLPGTPSPSSAPHDEPPSAHSAEGKDSAGKMPAPLGGALLGPLSPSSASDVSAGKMPAPLGDSLLGPPSVRSANENAAASKTPAPLVGQASSLPPSGAPTRFLFAGFLSQRKGIGYLLEAFRALPPGAATLALAGDWYDDGGAFQPLPDGVFWLGKLDRPALARAFAAADVFVLPSLCEGSALVLYEAMAAALPVITTRESGPPTTDPAHVALVPAADPDALAAALRRFVDDPAALAAARNAACAHAGDFTWRRSRDALRETVFEFLASRLP